jgi:putative membrane protein
MFELLIALIIGILLGIFTGLIPGIHTNFIAVFLVSGISFLLNIASTEAIMVLIVAMGLTNTFIDTIPSIYLGAPSEETALSVLPGHRMLLEGKGHEAIVYTVIGSSVAVVLFLILGPIFFFIIPLTEGFLEKMMAFFLIWACIFLIGREKESKTKALIIFILAGFLGISSMNLNINQPLLPLLTGLFGTSTLIYSISSSSKIPEQNTKKIKIDWKEIRKPTIATAITSPLCSFLPGMGSSQSAIIGSEIMGEMKPRSFLVLIGSTNTLVLAVSFLILFLTGKKRTGLAGAVSEILVLDYPKLLIIGITIIITAIISIFLTIKLSEGFAKFIKKVNYEKLSKIIIVFLMFVTLLVSGFMGLLVLLTSTVLGLTCAYLNVRKGFLMGCLMIPTILFYLPF